MGGCDARLLRVRPKPTLLISVHPDTGLIDHEDLSRLAGLFKPAMVVCGGSAYPRDWDYARFREIADANGALLLW